MLQALSTLNLGFHSGETNFRMVPNLWDLFSKETKKSTYRGLKKEVINFLWSPKGSFFHLAPQRKRISSRGLGQIFLILGGQFFQHMKKLYNFWNFGKNKVAKSKLNHLGFYCKLDFFDRKIRKVKN